MASAMANAVEISVHNAQPGGLLQRKESWGTTCGDQGTRDFSQIGCKHKGLIKGGSSYPVENGGITSGDLGTRDLSQTGCKLKELIEGSSSSPVPFFPSFLENLGPLYWASSPHQRLQKASEISLASGQPTKAHELECPSDKSDGDAVRVVLTFAETKLGNFPMTHKYAGAAVTSPDSSIRGVEDLILELNSKSNELTSTHKPLLTTSETPSSQRFVPLTSSKGHLLRSPRADGDAPGAKTEFQFQFTLDHVSSPRNTRDSFHLGPQQLGRKLSSRDLKGKQKALEDGWDGSPSLSSKRSQKRLRPDTEPLVPVTIASPILESRFRNPSCWYECDEVMCHGLAGIITGDFDAVRRSRYEEPWMRAARRAEGYHRMRMRTLREESIRKTNEAMDRTLVTLHSWRFLLGLDNPACPIVASHIFYRGLQKFQKSAWPIEMRDLTERLRVKVLLAVALWVTAKIIDNFNKVPKASEMARVAGIDDVKSLTHAELPLLDALHWKLVRH